MSDKRVRITIEADAQFVRLLNANVQLSGLAQKDEMDPTHQLALLVWAEMRGGTEAEVDALVLPMWRANLGVIHEERRVYEAEHAA